MRAIGYRQCIDSRRSRHLEVMRRIADHEGASSRHVELVHQLEKHGGMRLWVRLVGAARGAEIGPQPRRVEGAVEPAAALARCDAKDPLALQGLQQLAHATEEVHRMLARAEMLAIALDE